MKPFRKEDMQITNLVRHFVEEQVTEGDICIDATAGNGNDTLMLCRLCGKNGRVTAFDIQDQAVQHTRKLLEEHGFEAEVIKDSHVNMGRYVQPGTAACIMFNLGYLPGGDHSIATEARTSTEAIAEGLKLLCKGGLMTVCIYSGADSGFEEKEAVLKYVRELDPRKYLVIEADYVNRPNNPPVPVFIRKLQSEQSQTF